MLDQLPVLAAQRIHVRIADGIPVGYAVLEENRKFLSKIHVLRPDCVRCSGSDCRTAQAQPLALGESLSMIGKLLGHNKIETTALYAHLARDSIKPSSARVADSIGADILDRKREEAASP